MRSHLLLRRTRTAFFCAIKVLRWLCSLQMVPLFVLLSFFFSIAHTLSLGLYVRTSLGIASGVRDGGVYRFSVRYASAYRWVPSTVATKWALPCVFLCRLFRLKLNNHRNGSTNVTALPLPCPQPGLDPSAYSEDCLSMVLYVPTTLTLTSSASTLVWSFCSNCRFFHFLIPLAGFTEDLSSVDLQQTQASMAQI